MKVAVFDLASSSEILHTFLGLTHALTRDDHTILELSRTTDNASHCSSGLDLLMLALRFGWTTSSRIYGDLLSTICIPFHCGSHLIKGLFGLCQLPYFATPNLLANYGCHRKCGEQNRSHTYDKIWHENEL
jgi:hypothetical protein